VDHWHCRCCGVVSTGLLGRCAAAAVGGRAGWLCCFVDGSAALWLYHTLALVLNWPLLWEPHQLWLGVVTGCPMVQQSLLLSGWPVLACAVSMLWWCMRRAADLVVCFPAVLFASASWQVVVGTTLQEVHDDRGWLTMCWLRKQDTVVL